MKEPAIAAAPRSDAPSRAVVGLGGRDRFRRAGLARGRAGEGAG